MRQPGTVWDGERRVQLSRTDRRSEVGGQRSEVKKKTYQAYERPADLVETGEFRAWFKERRGYDPVTGERVVEERRA